MYGSSSKIIHLVVVVVGYMWQAAPDVTAGYGMLLYGQVFYEGGDNVFW